MEHILYLMTAEYKHGFLMTLLGLMSRSSPDSNKQYIVKIECKILHLHLHLLSFATLQ